MVNVPMFLTILYFFIFELRGFGGWLLFVAGGSITYAFLSFLGAKVFLKVARARFGASNVDHHAFLSRLGVQDTHLQVRTARDPIFNVVKLSLSLTKWAGTIGAAILAWFLVR